tara:strand:+ start:1168 stop:2043 length:876 start_codon:yes stop_codon:yes gene_type:complete
MKIIHYIDTSYEMGAFGGVPRFDNELKKILDIKTFTRPQRNLMLRNLTSDTIVITDNGMCMEVPENIKCVVVHHGCSLTHKRREPFWGGDYYVQSQNLMSKRKNTYFVAPSKFMQEEFKRHYNIQGTLIPHFSNLTPLKRPTKSKKILGDWRGHNKGEGVISRLQERNDFEYIQLNCDITEESKMKAYSEASIYLTLSLCEGCSYSQLDALACGLPVLSTDVSLFGGDCDDTCGEAIAWNKRDDLDLIEEKLMFMYENYDKYTPQKWVRDNVSLNHWEARWKKLIEEVQND